MTTQPCILCNSPQTNLIETIEAADLITLYKQRADISVERYFTEKQIAFYQCKNCGLKYYWPQVIGDGKFYDDLQRYSDYYPDDKPEFLEGAKYISHTDKVLEIGCGQGQFAQHLRCRAYTGLEFSENAITKAKQKGLTVYNQHLEQHADMYPHQYDVVCFFQVLEHVQQPAAFMKAALRCLKSHGKLILAVPAEDSFIRFAVNFYLNMPPHHASRWTDDTLHRIADLFNMKVISCFHEPLHDMHKSFYLKTMIYKKISKLVGLKYSSTNPHMLSTLIYGVAAILSKLARLPRNKTGQSVMMVYEKR